MNTNIQRTAAPLDLIGSSPRFRALLTEVELESGAFWPPPRPPNAVLTGLGCMF
jgi:hypothetical protein